MQTYRFQEGDMVLPLPAQDLTVNVLAFTPLEPAAIAPASANPELSVVMTRQIVDDAQSLETFVNEQLETLTRTMKGYRFVQRAPLFIDEREAELVEFTWQAQNGTVYQRQATVFCPVAVGFPTPQRIALTITATTLEKLQSKYEFTFQQILYSLRFHRG